MFQSFNAVVNFTVSRVNEPMSTVQQYEWAIKGWSKCSKECGGGKQHLVMRFETCSIRFFLFVGLELVTAKQHDNVSVKSFHVLTKTHRFFSVHLLCGSIICQHHVRWQHLSQI